MHMASLPKSAANESSGSSSEAVSEGARRATGETASEEAVHRDPEVVAIARRRKFSGTEKRRLLAEAEHCQAALAPKRRGPKPDVSARQIQRLERDNARLRHKLGRAELIIDAQKKLCVALGLPTAEEPSEDA